MVEGGIQVPLDTAANNGLLCQPRVFMMMEKSVEWLAGETEVLGENLLQCHFVHWTGERTETVLPFLMCVINFVQKLDEKFVHLKSLLIYFFICTIWGI
jgi:hypothetical protein